MVSKILNLLAISTLAILASSFGSTPVTALSVESKHLARHVPHAHGAIAKRKRGNNKRCKQRPSTSKTLAPSPTPAANNNNNNDTKNNGGSSKPAQTTTTKTSSPEQSTPKSDDNSGSSNSGSSGNSGSPASSGNRGKVGLAWPNGEDSNLSKFVNNNVQYLYTWSPYYPSKAKSLGLRPMPMLWGDSQISDFQRLVKEGYADIAMGMNEPNQAGQAEMSPEHAFDLWMKYLNPLHKLGYYLISPACTSAPSGFTWMQAFFKLCNANKDCHVDGVAVHYYDTSAQGFIDYVNKFHDAFGRDIWPTEFACQNFNGGPQCSKDQIKSFMSTVTSYFDKTSWIQGYFAFGVMHDMVNVNPDNQLMASNGSPTELGHQYIKG